MHNYKSLVSRAFASQPQCVVFSEKISANMFLAIPDGDEDQQWIPSPPDHPLEVKPKTAPCGAKHSQVHDKNSWAPAWPRLAGCRVSSSEGSILLPRKGARVSEKLSSFTS